MPKGIYPNEENPSSALKNCNEVRIDVTYRKHVCTAGAKFETEGLAIDFLLLSGFTRPVFSGEAPTYGGSMKPGSFTLCH